jgi:hypothetical protein
VDLIVGNSFRVAKRKVSYLCCRIAIVPLSLSLSLSLSLTLSHSQTPLPLAHVYCIDVSFAAQKAGVTALCVASLRSVFEHLVRSVLHAFSSLKSTLTLNTRTQDESALHVAILTYSDVVHCYDFSGGRPKVTTHNPHHYRILCVARSCVCSTTCWIAWRLLLLFGCDRAVNNTVALIPSQQMLVVHGGTSFEEMFCPSSNLVGSNRAGLLATLDLIPQLHSGSGMRQVALNRSE